MSSEIPKVVGEIMTREVITLFEEDNLDRIEEGMARYRFRHLPVVDEGRLVGLLTHRDLLRLQASILEPGAAQKTHALGTSVFVRNVMQRNVLTVTAETPLVEAGKLLVDNKLGCLPVVDADQTLVGIVTEADFVKLAVRLLASP